MKRLIAKIIHYGTVPFIYTTAIAFAVLALVQCALVAGFLWINQTRSGQDFLQGLITQATAATPYQIALDTLTYDPLRGLTMRDLTVADQDGLIAQADTITIQLGLAALPLRTLTLSLDAGRIDILRVPSAPADGQKEVTKPAPFSVPKAGFISRIILRHAQIDDLHIAKEVAGRPLHAAPRLTADVAFNDGMDADGTLYFGLGDDILPAAVTPDRLHIKARLRDDAPHLDLALLRVDNATMYLEGRGTASLNAPYDFDVTGAFSASDISTATAAWLESAEAHIHAHGNSAAPQGTLSAQMTPSALSALTAPLIIAGQLSNEAGNVDITSALYSEPITAQIAAALTDAAIDIHTINARSGAATIDGGILWDKASTLLRGTVNMRVPDIAPYAALAGAAASGDVQAALTLDSADENQTLSLNVKSQNITQNALAVDGINLQSSWASIKTAPLQFLATLKIDAVRNNGRPQAESISLTAAPQDDPSHVMLRLQAQTTAAPIDAQALLITTGPHSPALQDIMIRAGEKDAQITLSGALNAQDIDLRINAAAIKMRNFIAVMPAHYDSARADIDGHITGPLTAPQSQLQLSLRDGTAAGKTMTINAVHDTENARATLQGSGFGVRTLNGEMVLPLTLSLSPFQTSFGPQTPLSGKLTAAADIADIAAIALPAPLTVTGHIDLQTAINGTIAAPFIEGRMDITQGGLIDDANGIHIADLQGRVAMNRDILRLENITATDGSTGTLDIGGHYGLGQGGQADITVKARALHIPREGMANGYINADMRLRGGGTRYDLQGQLDVDRMEITIPERFATNIPQLNIVESADVAAKPPVEIHLALAVNAPGQVFVRGWGLDAELGGNIEVTGTAAKPLLDGTLSSIRGRYEEFGKLFTLDRANLRFQGVMPPSPYLDIRATTNTGDADAHIEIGGSASSPAIKLSATPQLPEDEVLSRILFGQSASRISPMQAIQLTQTLRRFTGQGGGGFDPLGALRGLTGIDNITMDRDEDGATNIGVGKYLNDRTYLQFETGSGEGGGAATLQIEVTPSIRVETEIGQDASTGGGVFWRRDY